MLQKSWESSYKSTADDNNRRKIVQLESKSDRRWALIIVKEDNSINS